MTPDEALNLLRQMWNQFSTTPPMHAQLGMAFNVLDNYIRSSVPVESYDGTNVPPVEVTP